MKPNFNEQYKACRNLFLPLMKQSKKRYQKKCFENRDTIKNIENKVMKTSILIKNIPTKIPHLTEFSNRTTASRTDMGNVFNNYFTSIAEKT